MKEDDRMQLQDKVVFITDADSASGRAVLTRLAAEGAYFILNSASHDADLDSELKQCRKLGSRVIVDHIDLCSTAAVSALLDRAAAEIGPIDVLVHNNRLVLPCDVETCDEALFQDIIRTNAKSALITAQAAGNRMKERQSGKIIFVGSIHAEKPTGSSFAYSAARGAVQILSREASLVLGRYGIQVNHIMMGPVEGDNERFRSDITNLYIDYEYKVPGAILGTNHDLADLVLFLSSDQSNYMNGADIRLDGGFLGHYIDVRTKKPY
jgi:glucose 1-dehydrogenase